MDGFAVGAVCYRETGEAVAAACSAVAGVTSGGVVSCEAPSFSAPVVSYTLVAESASGRVTRAASMELQPCDPVDLVEFGPVIAAWFLALVTILAARSVYTKVFGRETS